MQSPSRIDRAAIGAPSPAGRALVSVALFLGFQALTIGIALTLLSVPIVALLYPALLEAAFAVTLTIKGLVFAFVLTWIPGMLLLQGALLVRPPPFRKIGRKLERPSAPELFDMLDHLASSAQTGPPSEVILSALPELAMVQTGGTLGVGSRRVLVLGAPVLEELDVEALRAALAHEYGRYAFGGMRSAGAVAYTEAAFGSVLETVELSPFRDNRHVAIEGGFLAADFLGKAIVGLWAGIFFAVTARQDRSQVLAADALAAALAGPEAAVRALSTVRALGPLYTHYLTVDVEKAASSGAFPSDLAAGFRMCRARLAERGAERDLVESAAARSRGVPALFGERLARLRAMAAAPPRGDARPGSELLAEPSVMRAAMVEATRDRMGYPSTLELLPWSEITDRVIVPAIRERGREMAAALHPSFPAATTQPGMFAAVIEALEGGMSPLDLAQLVDPRLPHVDEPARSTRATATAEAMVAVLFQGALLAHGARARLSLGEPCLVFELGQESVQATVLARAAMLGREARGELGQWAKRLS